MSDKEIVRLQNEIYKHEMKIQSLLNQIDEIDNDAFVRVRDAVIESLQIGQ